MTPVVGQEVLGGVVRTSRCPLSCRCQLTLVLVRTSMSLVLFQVDPLGPLLTLRRLLLSDKALATFRLFITKYWYTVILAAIAVMGLMVTIVKLCGKKTPLLERRRRRRPR